MAGSRAKQPVDSTGRFTFHSGREILATLLRDSDWKLSTMDENHALDEFLKAIRLTPSELQFEFIMNDKERDTVIQKVAEFISQLKATGKCLEL